MTRPLPSGSHLPICLHETTEEDRKTYRKWARSCCVFYVLLVAGLLSVGLFTRHSDMRTATDGQTAGIGIVAKPVELRHSGG
jgi:hypothetical protein